MNEWLPLRPTQEQYREFADYLCEAHSWYKHLPLTEGRRFVVFVASDAGTGRVVAMLDGPDPETATGFSLVTPPEGPEFTEEHPRLHYSWKTTREYRNRFGYLDYMTRQDAEPYCRDVGSPIPLPPRVEERCSFVLYPYVSWTFSEAVCWDIHEEAIAQLQSGASHPAREMVLQLTSLAQTLEATWQDLTNDEREWIASRGLQDAELIPSEPSPTLGRYLEIENGVTTVASLLRSQEVKKIQHALAELDDWLLHEI